MPPRAKATPLHPMRINAYSIIARAIEEGVRSGWNRAHKHTDEPDDGHIQDAIESAVISAVCEVIDFEVGDP